MGEVVPKTLTAARCVSFRDLARLTAGLMSEIEKDGKIFAISRYGRIVALLLPLPERLTLEFESGVPMQTSEEPEVDMSHLELTDLASEFLIDAASTPTGYWSPPDSARRALDATALFYTLDRLAEKELALWESGTRLKITRKGRAVANHLLRRGVKGYGEAHGDPYLDP